MVVTSVNFSKLSLRMVKDSMCHTYRDPHDRTGDEDITGQVVVVTGSSGGIGKEVALALAKRNATVVMACRDQVKTAKVMKEIQTEVPQAKLEFVKLDLSYLDLVRRCAKEICKKFPNIRILVNNAGYMGTHPAEWTKEGLEKRLVTNHLGPFLLTLSLLRSLVKGGQSRIVNVGATAFEVSELDLDDLNLKKKNANLGFMNLGAYANSKMCNFLFTKKLAKLLEGTQVRTYWLCPGIVSTNLISHWTGLMGFMSRMSAKAFGVTEKQGTETILHCALASETSQETGGSYRVRRHWPEADKFYNEEDATKVWELSEKFVGLKFSNAFP